MCVFLILQWALPLRCCMFTCTCTLFHIFNTQTNMHYPDHTHMHMYACSNTQIPTVSKPLSVSPPITLCCSILLPFQKIKRPISKALTAVITTLGTGERRNPLSALPKEGFLPHCRWVESEGCGVYLEGCWCGNFGSETMRRCLKTGNGGK